MLIVITGPDGAGKSTASKTVAKSLESFYGQNSVAAVSPWDAAPQLFSSRINARNYLNTLNGPACSLFILYGIQRALDLAQKKNPKIILFDSYWYKYVVSEIGRGESKEWLFDVVKIFPKPDLIFYLPISPKEAALRKTLIREYESGGAIGATPFERFIHFQTQLQPIWREVEAHTGCWKHVSGLLSQDEIVQQILNECIKKVA